MYKIYTSTFCDYVMIAKPMDLLLGIAVHCSTIFLRAPTNTNISIFALVSGSLPSAGGTEIADFKDNKA